MRLPLVVRIRGGLGNQLFQYASALGIADATGRTLLCDTKTGFPRDIYKRSYRLAALERAPREAGRVELALTRARSFRGWRSFRDHEANAMLADGTSFHASLLAGSGPRYLEAYLQSPRYFERVADVVRRELWIPEKGVRHGENLARIAPHRNAVALHVRRKDYSPLLPASYYREAVERVRAVAPDAHFFVLGDDPEWVERELGWLAPRTALASEGPNADWLDLALIAACRHRIIANSSFSWWGAWLSRHDGEVVAPARWWNDHRPQHLFPSGWHVLAVEGS